MTFPEFEKFQAELHAEILIIASTKGKEYAHDADRFANFRRLATQLDLKDYQIGWVYATKHLDSIVSYMKEGKTFSTESIRGRFLDAIFYLELIAGMVEDSEMKQNKIATHNTNKITTRALSIDQVNIGAICNGCSGKFIDGEIAYVTAPGSPELYHDVCIKNKR